jgi:hypothetical protein
MTSTTRVGTLPSWRRGWAGAAALAIWIVACPMVTLVHATTLVPADFSEMVAESQVIVHGRVLTVRSTLTGGRSRTIERLVTVSVIDSMKGAVSQTVVFRVPGGQVGRYRRVMVGAPEFAEGDEVVVFLKGRAPAVPMPFGLSQGVYRVAPPDGQRLVTPLPSAGRVVRGDPARRPLAVDAFARAVRTLVDPRP